MDVGNQSLRGRTSEYFTRNARGSLSSGTGRYHQPCSEFLQSWTSWPVRSNGMARRTCRPQRSSSLPQWHAVLSVDIKPDPSAAGRASQSTRLTMIQVLRKQASPPGRKGTKTTVGSLPAMCIHVPHTRLRRTVVWGTWVGHVSQMDVGSLGPVATGHQTVRWTSPRSPS